MPARFLKLIEKPKKRIVTTRNGSSALITVGDAQALHKVDLDKLTALIAQAPLPCL